MRTSICFYLLAIATFVLLAGICVVQAEETTKQGPKSGVGTIIDGVWKVVTGALTIVRGAVQIPVNILGKIAGGFAGIISNFGGHKDAASGGTTTPKSTNKTA